jgi:hypothetical protein
MGDWYEIGLAMGIGVALGIASAGVLANRRLGLPATALVAVVAGGGAGFLVHGWSGAVGGAVGGALGGIAAASIVRGAGARGATPGGTALLLLVAAVVVGLLVLIPLVGYLVAVVFPAAAVRRARRSPEKYAGLRSLAK